MRERFRRARAFAWAGLLLLLLLPAGQPKADLAGHGGPVKSIAVAGDGRTVVTGGFDYAVIVWDWPAGTQRFRLEGHDGPVNAVALLPGDAQAVSVGDDGAALVWNLQDGSLERRFETGAKLVAVAVAPDGAELAAAGWDGKVHRWRLTDGSPLPALAHEGQRLNALAYAADGRTLTAGGHEGELSRWRPADAVKVAGVAGHDFGVTALARLPDGRLVSAGIDRRVRIWAAQASDAATLEAHEQPVTALAVSRDGAHLASGGIGGQIILWSLAEARPERVLDTQPQPIWALAFTADAGELLIGGADGTVRVWDRAAGLPIAMAAEPDPPAPDDPHGAALLEACIACHILTPEGPPRAGPTLHGVFGRRAGSVPGYPYSQALRESDLVWTEETMSRLFELGPHEFVPGSKMPLQRLPEPRDRARLIAYLKRVTGPAITGGAEPEAGPR